MKNGGTRGAAIISSDLVFSGAFNMLQAPVFDVVKEKAILPVKAGFHGYIHQECSGGKGGFEPTEPFGSAVFKTLGINHSPTFPYPGHGLFCVARKPDFPPCRL